MMEAIKSCSSCKGPVSPSTGLCTRCGKPLAPMWMADPFPPLTLPPLPTLVLPPLPSLAVPSPAREASTVALAPARVLLADPPWAFGDKLPGGGRGAEKHYKTMPIEEIKKFPLPPLADNAVLFLWRVEALEEKAETSCYEIARAWGFVPKSKITWVKSVGDGETVEGGRRRFKVKMGMGHYTRRATEDCIIAIRSSAKPSACHPEVHDVLDWFDAPIAEHSAKPDRLYEIIERMYPGGPYTELFARRRRAGWQQLGDELPATETT